MALPAAGSEVAKLYIDNSSYGSDSAVKDKIDAFCSANYSSVWVAAETSTIHTYYDNNIASAFDSGNLQWMLFWADPLLNQFHFELVWSPGTYA